MRDQKAALGNASKPDITHVRGTFMNYVARACEYGSAKYQRGNYLRPAGSTRDDFIRYGAYLRSAISHLTKCLDRMEAHRAGDPDLTDIEGMKRAAFAADPDVTPGAKVGASGLPHVAHGAAGLMMAIVQACKYGLLPDDPGQPWAAEEAPRELVQAVAEGLVETEPAPPAGDKCKHERPIGMACHECKGWARREL